jgi:hypothetical protein
MNARKKRTGPCEICHEDPDHLVRENGLLYFQCRCGALIRADTITILRMMFPEATYVKMEVPVCA